ncbi:MAG: DoxX family protein [Acidobacteriia bacterium]|nr:DoxX family protein [Terriglobia bacterium]
MSSHQFKTVSGWGFTILRLAVGIVFFAHGWQKLFGYGLHNVSASMGMMHIPLAAVSGPLVTFLEFVGGLALILGVLTRWFAALFVIEMLVAILGVHLRNGFFLPRGYEYPFMMLAASLALVLEGPGKAALDRLWTNRK